MSPSDSGAAVTRCSLTNVPLVLPRSTMRYAPATLRSSAWWLDTLRSETTMSLSGARPMRSVVVGNPDEAAPLTAQLRTGPSAGSPSRTRHSPLISIRSTRRFPA